MSESRRALLRIVSNLLRLIGSVAIGLLLIRLLLRSVGGDVVGLISLLGNTMGLASALEESVENSMVRELGRAHHSGDVAEFRRTYNSALVVSSSAAGCSAILYVIIACILPLLSISEGLRGAAFFFLGAKAVESLVIITLSPAYNMYMVKERMIAVNILMFARRGCGLIAAAITLAAHPESAASGLIMFAWLAAVCQISVLCAAVGWAILRDPRLRPTPSLADRRTSAEIVRTSGTNASIYATQLLQIPACAILMNLVFGLPGNLIFGLGVQCAGYVRMLAIGFATGIEAVTARLSTRDVEETQQERLRTLAYHATRLQGFVTVAAAVGMFVIAPSFIRVWLRGEAVDEHALHQMTVLARILVFGVAAQAILDVWWRMLYGAGFIRHYARPFAVVAIITVPIGWLLMQSLPHEIAYVGPSVSYAVLNLVLALAIIPRVASRSFGVPTARLLMLLGRPAVPAALAAAATWAVDRAWQPPTLVSLCVAGGVFGTTFLALAYPLVLEPLDRKRVAALLRRGAGLAAS